MDLVKLNKRVAIRSTEIIACSRDENDDPNAMLDRVDLAWLDETRDWTEQDWAEYSAACSELWAQKPETQIASEIGKIAGTSIER
ncbi:MAG: hypothetical protein ABIR37_03325 [Candidatus Saccharimonadales bacterium]